MYLFNDSNSHELEPHQLSYEQLLVEITGLSKSLLRPNLTATISPRHFHLWSWCAEVILHQESEVFDQHTEIELRKLFDACLRASLVHSSPPKLLQETASRNVDTYINSSLLILSYLVFPLLEGVCKKLCSDYISMDGMVKKDFNVPSRIRVDGKTNKGSKNSNSYTPFKAKGKKNQCSSIRDLLLLTELNHPSIGLAEVIHYIPISHPEQIPFDVIQDWRNNSLHGSAAYQTIGGTLLNITLFLLIKTVNSDTYSYLRRMIMLSKNNDSRNPWSYYPPY